MSSPKSRSLHELLEPVVESMDCQLWGLEFHGTGTHKGLLRIYIEKADGVLVEDCARVSRQISSVLDVEDPIQGEYVLEVSSPGMDRPLYTAEQFQEYSGERAQIKLRLPFNGRKQFTGQLTGVEDDEVKLVVDEEEYFFPIESIDKAKVVPQYDLPSNSKKPGGKGKKDGKRG